MSDRQTRVSNLPPCYASQRAATWSVDAAESSSPGYPHLSDAWRRSRDTLHAIQSHLAAAKLDPRILTIAVSGSLGRMEQVARSDGDILVVLQAAESRQPESQGADSRGAAMRVAESQAHVAFACRAVDSVWSALRPLNLPMPAADGIFAVASTESELLSPRSLGQLDEDRRTFGHRIQLLLDSQPVFAPANFDGLVRKIALRYASDDLNVAEPYVESRGGVVTWNYLRNDLVRYYRCLANDAIWRRRNEPAGWRQFQLKVRYSRCLLYAGLMGLLGESLTGTDGAIDWLVAALKLTPLERLQVLPDSDGRFSSIASAYDRFLAQMHDESFHAALAGEHPARDTTALTENTAYRELAGQAIEFQQSIAQLWLSQHDRWPSSALLGLWF